MQKEISPYVRVVSAIRNSNKNNILVSTTLWMMKIWFYLNYTDVLINTVDILSSILVIYIYKKYDKHIKRYI